MLIPKISIVHSVNPPNYNLTYGRLQCMAGGHKCPCIAVTTSSNNHAMHIKSMSYEMALS